MLSVWRRKRWRRGKRRCVVPGGEATLAGLKGTRGSEGRE